MDDAVLRAQQWYNIVYADITGAVTEDGQTGWQTMRAFTRALQYELGISPQVDTFGPTTLARLASQVGDITSGSPPRIVGLYQCALWCKGYWGGQIDGDYGPITAASTFEVTNAMGIGPSEHAAPKVVKSVFTLDAYELLPGGSSTVRSRQRWLNYWWDRTDFFIIPTDGIYSRSVQQGLMLVIQYNLGMADGVANGTFGPGTRQGLRDLGILQTGDSDDGTGKHWNRLAQAALVFNGYDTINTNGQFDTEVANAVRDFQSFTAIPSSGTIDFTTWAELLVSTGDPDRQVAAFDTSTPLTSDSAAALHAAGMRSAGRYLSGPTKGIQPGELDIIRAADLDLWVYCQAYNNESKWFDRDQGYAQARDAVERAVHLGLPRDTPIFFVVDYDPLIDEVAARIIPFFQGVRDGLAHWPGVSYRAGVYGTRMVCTMVSDAGLAQHSSILGLSTGYGGNLGQLLPANWTFNQIREYQHPTAGIRIDNVVHRPSDALIPAGDIQAPPVRDGHFDTAHRYLISVQLRAIHEISFNNPEQFFHERAVCFILMWEGYLQPGVPNYLAWQAYSGYVAWTQIPELYFEHMAAQAAAAELPAPSPSDYFSHGALGHMAAAAVGMLEWENTGAGSSEVSVAELGGWALDLVTFWTRDYVQYLNNNVSKIPAGIPPYDPATGPVSIEEFVDRWLGNTDIYNGENVGNMPRSDLIGDTDAFAWVYMLREQGYSWDEALNTWFRERARSETWSVRRFIETRFESSPQLFEAVLTHLFTTKTVWIDLPVEQFNDTRLPGEVNPEGPQPNDPTGPLLTQELPRFIAAVRTKLWELAGL